ncbi:hypothetical protein WDU94_011165, partial [Cyamophila willieti]
MSEPQKPRARGRGTRAPAQAAPGAAAAAAVPAQAPPANVRARARASSLAQGVVPPTTERPGGMAQITQQLAQTKIGSTGSSDTDTTAGSTLGRGMVRGRRINEETTDRLVRTRPQHIVNKK